MRGGGRVVIRISQKLTGRSGKFYLDKTKILRFPPPPLLKAENNDHSLRECVRLLLIFKLLKNFTWISVFCVCAVHVYHSNRKALSIRAS